MIEAKRLLVIAPHPDDEILGCGGTMALAAERGAEVHVLVVFDGAAGDPETRFDRADYVARRRGEARAGGKLLGIENYYFWDFAEGHVPSPEEIDVGATRLAELVASLRPDVILAPWSGDAHPDHETVSRALARMLQLTPFGGEVWGFEVWSPLQAEHLVDVSSVWDDKLNALRKHETQLAYDDLVQKITALATRHDAGLLEAFTRMELHA